MTKDYLDDSILKELFSNQLIKLAEYLIKIPNEPSVQESPVDSAIRLLTRYRAAFQAIANELGVPTADYPANITNAADLANGELNGESQLEYVLGLK